MQITATVRSFAARHEAMVATDGVEQAVAIAPRASGPGSSLNGGELLLLAMRVQRTRWGSRMRRRCAWKRPVRALSDIDRRST